MNLVNTIDSLNRGLNDFLWGKLCLYLLIFMGISLSFRLKFFHIRHIKLWWSHSGGSIFKREGHSGKNGTITPFQSACISLGATLGVGNIVGVSSAIYMGGPGAVFWMWIAAFFGMIISYAENILGTYFRRKNFDGEMSGGPMYYLSEGLKSKKGRGRLSTFLSYAFCICAIFASFGIGSMGQVNKIVLNIRSAFPSDKLQSIVVYGNTDMYSVVLGGVIFCLALVAVIGGIKTISRFTEKLVPVMIIFFVGGSLAVILKNYKNIIPSFLAIFKFAFGYDAIAGGATASMIKLSFEHGFKRGVFSNEAGLGSSCIVHSSSSVAEPCEQGMWGIFEVFVDTILVCTITALVVLCSGVYSPHAVSGDDSSMVAVAFGTLFSYAGLGEKFIAISIFLFAFSSCIGWSFYGIKSCEYIFGASSKKVFKILHLVSMFLGAVVSSEFAWRISDTFNALMMLPNLVGIFLLSPLICEINNNYIARKIYGEDIAPIIRGM